MICPICNSKLTFADKHGTYISSGIGTDLVCQNTEHTYLLNITDNILITKESLYLYNIAFTFIITHKMNDLFSATDISIYEAFRSNLITKTYDFYAIPFNRPIKEILDECKKILLLV